MKSIFNKDFSELENDDVKLRLINTNDGDDKVLPFYWWEIISKDLGIPVGKIGFRIGHNYHSYYNGNVGYEVDEIFQGNSYAYKACKLLIRVAKHHKMNYLIFSCNYDNIASCKTIEKLGAVLLEEVQPPVDYAFYYVGIPLHRIYRLNIK